MRILSARKELFARAVADGKTNREAAILAGYSERSATCLGSQLARQSRVAERIRELRDYSVKPVRTSDTVVAQFDSVQPVTIRDSAGRPLGLFIPVIALQTA